MNESETNAHESVVNSQLWRTRFTIAMADSVKAEKYAGHWTAGRTRAWLSGWRDAWTQAYITICSVLDSETYDMTMLVRWCDAAEAGSWDADTPILRRWKNRDTDRWEYAVVGRLDANGWGYDGSEFLRLD